MKLRASLPQFAFVLLFVAASLCAAQTYTVTDLGTVSGDDYSVARSVNAAGEITGAVGSDKNNLSDIFVYNAGEMTSLGTLGGTSGIGNGINASGQVAGYSTNTSGTYRAFLSSGGTLADIVYSGGKMKDLNQLIPAGSGWVLEQAFGINNTGQIVGTGTHRGQEHAFLLTLK